MIEFEEDTNPKKVRIIPKTEEAKAWCSQLPEASLRIRKGSEKFALRAFSLWKANKGTKDLEARLKAAREVLNKEIRASKATDPDSIDIVTCSALMKHVFKINFKDTIKRVTENEHSKIVQLGTEGLIAQGKGSTLKKAKAKAARAFIKVVEKQARKEVKNEKSNMEVS